MAEVVAAAARAGLSRVQGLGFRVFSALAFACGTPQSPPSDADFQAFVDRIMGAAAPTGVVAQMRRLHFEASTLVVAQLKISGDGSDAPQKAATCREGCLQCRCSGPVCPE